MAAQEGLNAASVRIPVEYNPGRRGEALTCRLLYFFQPERRNAGMNKRKRVAIAKHRAKKKRTKARASSAR
ncbi:MAG TPA: hypothetical protein VIN01_03065 [Candidatus Dormibacteraeota bacterium]|jgi:hypothetical protein